jgi:hypothetical protein
MYRFVFFFLLFQSGAATHTVCVWLAGAYCFLRCLGSMRAFFFFFFIETKRGACMRRVCVFGGTYCVLGCLGSMWAVFFLLLFIVSERGGCMSGPHGGVGCLGSIRAVFVSVVLTRGPYVFSDSAGLTVA